LKRIGTKTLYKIFVYVALISLAISIIIPVGWVFMASFKKNSVMCFVDAIKLISSTRMVARQKDM